MEKKSKRRVVILGAAGRDYHNFNVFFRDNDAFEVVAFTQAPEQNLSEIEGEQLRTYPPSLAGKLYLNGIPTLYETDLEKIIRKHDIDVCVMAYSDGSYKSVGNLSARANAAGADFWLMGHKTTQVKSIKPLISVCAVRTGCGKSQVSRFISDLLNKSGKRCVAVRHPMPYGDLAEQKVQRFATYDDLDKEKCTIEEMEEYEPYVERGMVIYAGVDYEAILRAAEKESDVVLWDGGNNDMSFYKPDLLITVADAHRPGHEFNYYPGEVNFRAADVVIISKIDSAKPEDVRAIEENARQANPRAKIIKAESRITVKNGETLKGKRVIVVEDGPTLTHGGMSYGAGIVAAKRLGCKIVDARPYAVGSVKRAFEKYKQLDAVLPAMGYDAKQMKELEQTIANAGKDVDAVIIGTPIDLGRHIKIAVPAHRVYYDYIDEGGALKNILREKGFL